MTAKQRDSEDRGELSATIVIRPDETISVINPNIYGHFAEHLGRCIYDGIWVGPDSPIPNDAGCRQPVVDALRRLKAPVMRWPGGSFADAYHWEDGIGPVERRPKRWNLWWEREEPNTFGTDEFLLFCQKVGAQPYIAVNLGSGTPQEALAWMEYCNSVHDTPYTRLRAANGHPEPYGVKYWGIGNESWGSGGFFDPESYATEYKRFATYLRRASLQGNVQLVACGHTRQNWNARFFHRLRDIPLVIVGGHQLINHISIHHYFRAGGDIEFSDNDYRTLIADIDVLERHIQDAIAVIDEFTRGEAFIGLIVDEWGMWHPQAVTANGLEQQNTLRDAILAASVLNVFNRYAACISMANLAQTVNVLQCVALTKDTETILTPTFHVFNLYKDHMGAKVVATEVDTPSFSGQKSHESRAENVPVIDVSSSLKRKHLLVTIVNRELNCDVEVRIVLRGKARFRSSKLTMLTSENVRDRNDSDRPDRVKPISKRVEAEGRSFHYIVPAHSVNAFTFGLA